MGDNEIQVLGPRKLSLRIFFRRPELEFNNTKFVLLICELLYLLVLLLKSKEFGVLTFHEKVPPALACFRN